MPAGRPREVSLPPDEMIELGKELVAWAKDDMAKPPRIRFAQFYAQEKHILRRDWKAMVQVPEFLPYYEEAQAFLASRCLDTNKLHHSFGHRFIRLYDRELVEEEDEQVRFKAEQSRKVDEEAKAEIRAIVRGTMDQEKKPDA